MIEFPCSCGQTLKAGLDRVGKKVRCPTCQSIQVVPAASPAPAAAPSSTKTKADIFDGVADESAPPLPKPKKHSSAVFMTGVYDAVHDSGDQLAPVKRPGAAGGAAAKKPNPLVAPPPPPPPPRPAAPPASSQSGDTSKAGGLSGVGGSAGVAAGRSGVGSAKKSSSSSLPATGTASGSGVGLDDLMKSGSSEQIPQMEKTVGVGTMLAQPGLRSTSSEEIPTGIAAEAGRSQPVPPVTPAPAPAAAPGGGNMAAVLFFAGGAMMLLAAIIIVVLLKK